MTLTFDLNILIDACLTKRKTDRQTDGETDDKQRAMNSIAPVNWTYAEVSDYYDTERQNGRRLVDRLSRLHNKQASIISDILPIKRSRTEAVARKEGTGKGGRRYRLQIYRKSKPKASDEGRTIATT